MKKLAFLTGLLFFLASPAAALDLESFLEGNSGAFPATGLERIQNTIDANQENPLDRFLSGTGDQPTAFPGGLDRFLGGDGSQASSPVRGIIDAFIERGFEGLGQEGGQDGTDEGGPSVDDDLPFFSGGDTLFTPPEVDGDDPLVFPEDDEFFSPEGFGTWLFGPGSPGWGPGSTQ